MRSLLGRLDTLDLELDPVAFFEMMDASIKGQQELKSVFGRSVGHIMSGYDNKILHLRGQGKAFDGAERAQSACRIAHGRRDPGKDSTWPIRPRGLLPGMQWPGNADRAWAAIDAQRAHTQLAGNEIFWNPATCGDLGIPRPPVGGLETAVRFATASCAALTPLARLVEPQGSSPGIPARTKRPQVGPFCSGGDAGIRTLDALFERMLP